VTTLLGAPYTANQMTYDLRRLRLKGLITRPPHTNTYLLTDEDQRVAIFYTKLRDRLLRPLLAAHDPPTPLDLRQAL
jgi:predicted MarR family transcription regulator